MRDFQPLLKFTGLIVNQFGFKEKYKYPLCQHGKTKKNVIIDFVNMDLAKIDGLCKIDMQKMFLHNYNIASLQYAYCKNIGENEEIQLLGPKMAFIMQHLIQTNTGKFW